MRGISMTNYQVYFPELLGPLLRSLIHLTTPPFTNEDHPELRPKVIISYKVRSLLKETPFWSAFGLWFYFEPVLYRPKPSTLKEASDLINITGTCLSTDRSQGTREDHDEGDEWRIYGASGDNESPTFVFVGRRRPESAFWWVPDSDEGLLAGAGAHGTDTTKSDNTFESILFLNLLVED
ncbi:hypothetical protein QCA50_014434 [Cerrena zonata]|uniref:Uncharacterized protein n=1 Tax=Cerrena zonata TaxID=2478898 RepID=A0AAW0FSV8_9APHY